jgi:hypothetical protein
LDVIPPGRIEGRIGRPREVARIFTSVELTARKPSLRDRRLTSLTS